MARKKGEDRNIPVRVRVSVGVRIRVIVGVRVRVTVMVRFRVVVRVTIIISWMARKKGEDQKMPVRVRVSFRVGFRIKGYSWG
jgi:hypothetical protein